MAVLEKNITGRIRVLRAIVVLLVAAYSINLLSLQIFKKEIFKSEAERVSMQWTRIPAPRGEIYDRSGKVLLAGNTEAYSVYLTPSDLPESRRAAVIDNLARILGLRREEIESKILALRGPAYGRITVAKNASLAAIAEIAAHVEDLPGVSWSARPFRSYPELRSLSNVIGYVGAITRDEFKLLYNKGYTIEDVTGKAGIELVYEELLKGKDGWITKAIDAKGRDISSKEAKIEAPIPGKRLVLSIDSTIQKIAEDALGQRQGSVIVMKPSTGEVLALVTYPYYDSRIFLSDNAGAEYLALLDDPGKPMLNRAYQSSYPPASTFKTVLTTAAIEEKSIDLEKKIYCAGEMNYGGRTWNCHIKRPGHGPLNLREALAESCDIYYWTLGRDYLGIENIDLYALEYGYGKPTGIDLPGENEGNLPTPTWKEDRYNEAWTLGDTMNLSIGQGYLLSSPLQVANMMAMIVNGGVVYKPHVLKEVRDPQTGVLVNEVQPEVLHKSSISPKTFETVRAYLRGVITNGTARTPISTKAVQIAGKTGTAEVGLKNRWHSWFASFGPYGAEPKDQIVVVTMVEASNPWEWWAPYAANVIYQAIFAGQDAETAAKTVGVNLRGSVLGGRRE